MSAIDFQSIRYTTAGLECYYLGQRRSVDGNVHRFAVVNPAGEKFAYYNDQGQRIEFDDRTGKWVVTPTGHQIIAPPKIVEVTRWMCFRWMCFMVNPSDAEHPVVVHMWDRHPSAKQIENAKYFKIDKHTWNIEVPND